VQQVILEPEKIDEKTVTVVSQSQLASKLGLQPEQATRALWFLKPPSRRLSKTAGRPEGGSITYQVIRKLENSRDLA